MDMEVLGGAIKVCVGAEVGLRFKYINSAKYDMDRDERKKWMAIHIETDTRNAKKVERGLKRIYSSQSTSFPLGIRMRLISEYRKVKGNPTNSAKHTRLRIRQANFLKMLNGCPGDDIAQLDFKAPKLGNQSLRDMIMAIQSNNDKTPGSLFHSVGMDWKGRYVFSYIASKEEEVTMISDGIIPYILYHYGVEARSFFDPDALIEKEEWSWDTETKSIVNPLSTELETVEKIDGDYSFDLAMIEGANAKPAEALVKSTPTAQELAIARMNVLINTQGADDESVSTMGSAPVSVSGNLISMSPGKSPQKTPRANNAASVLSSNSYESRLTAVEDRIGSMENNLKESFQASIKDLVAQLTGAVSPQATKEVEGTNE